MAQEIQCLSHVSLKSFGQTRIQKSEIFVGNRTNKLYYRILVHGVPRMKILIAEKLERLLQSKWTEFLDSQQIMRLCLEYARNTAYKTLQQKEIPKVQFRASVTKFVVTEPPSEFEIWIEFSIPKDNGVIIGTHVLSLSLAGEAKLKESHGTHFVVETS